MTEEQGSVAGSRKAAGKRRTVVGAKEQRRKASAQLPQFGPIVIDYDPVAKNSGEPTIQRDAIERLKASTNLQLDELLSGLGLKRTDENVWERAFLALAAIHHGVGAIAIRDPKPSNRNAATWSVAQDDILASRAAQLQNEGHSLTEALHIIAREAKTWQKLPQPSGSQRVVSTEARRFATYKKRLQHLERSTTILSKALGLHLTEIDMRRLSSDVIAPANQPASSVSKKPDDTTPTG